MYSLSGVWVVDAQEKGVKSHDVSRGCGVLARTGQTTSRQESEERLAGSLQQKQAEGGSDRSGRQRAKTEEQDWDK